MRILKSLHCKEKQHSVLIREAPGPSRGSWLSAGKAAAAPERFIETLPRIVMLAFAIGRLHSARAAVVVLAIASLYFYAAWKHAYVFLLLGSIVLNFLLGLLVSRHDRRRAMVITRVILNLLLLGYFKYAPFLAENFNLLVGTNVKFDKIVLPIGISYFTFQQIAYLVDLRRSAPVERNPVNFTLFVTFFLHLIAGPPGAS
jgi:alginate O-acetyltransferase complex protein AlgI